MGDYVREFYLSLKVLHGLIDLLVQSYASSRLFREDYANCSNIISILSRLLITQMYCFSELGDLGDLEAILICINLRYNREYISISKAPNSFPLQYIILREIDRFNI